MKLKRKGKCLKSLVKLFKLCVSIRMKTIIDKTLFFFSCIIKSVCFYNTRGHVRFCVYLINKYFNILIQILFVVFDFFHDPITITEVIDVFVVFKYFIYSFLVFGFKALYLLSIVMLQTFLKRWCFFIYFFFKLIDPRNRNDRHY